MTPKMSKAHFSGNNYEDSLAPAPELSLPIQESKLSAPGKNILRISKNKVPICIVSSIKGVNKGQTGQPDGYGTTPNTPAGWFQKNGNIKSQNNSCERLKLSSSGVGMQTDLPARGVIAANYSELKKRHDLVNRPIAGFGEARPTFKDSRKSLATENFVLRDNGMPIVKNDLFWNGINGNLEMFPRTGTIVQQDEFGVPILDNKNNRGYGVSNAGRLILNRNHRSSVAVGNVDHAADNPNTDPYRKGLLKVGSENVSSLRKNSGSLAESYLNFGPTAEAHDTKVGSRITTTEQMD